MALSNKTIEPNPNPYNHLIEHDQSKFKIQRDKILYFNHNKKVACWCSPQDPKVEVLQW